MGMKSSPVRFLVCRRYLGLEIRHLQQALHTFGGGVGQRGDGAAGVGVNGFGVDEVYVGFGGYAVEQSGGGIDIERGADDDEDVSLFGFAAGVGHAWHGLAEEHDERSQQTAVGGPLPGSDVGVVRGQGDERSGIVGAARGAGLHEFAVEMDDTGGAGTLMQVVDVLCHHAYLKALLELRYEAVSGVGLRLYQLPAQVVVEVRNKGRVGLPALGGGYFFNRVLLPQSARVAEGAEAAFGAHAGAGEEYDFFHDCV